MLKPSKESQPELFGEQLERPKKTRSDSIKSFFRLRANPFYSISLEQILIFLIVLFILFIIVFMMGVERGKTIRHAARAAAAAQAAGQAQQLPPVVYQTGTPAALPRGQTASRTPPPAVSAPAAAAQPKSVANQPGKPYTIQAITYRSEERARKEISDLQAKGFQARLISKGGYIAVCVGQYANRQEAEKDIRRLQGSYKDCYLRKI